MPDSKITTDLVTDGQEHEILAPGLPATKMKAIAEWQGGTLVVTATGRDFMGTSSKTMRRYYLSDDASQLIELVEGQYGFGETALRLVFDKQP
jgi:hypothetical protein